jgi:hypothetical protein
MQPSADTLLRWCAGHGAQWHASLGAAQSSSLATVSCDVSAGAEMLRVPLSPHLVINGVTNLGGPSVKDIRTAIHKAVENAKEMPLRDVSLNLPVAHRFRPVREAPWEGDNARPTVEQDKAWEISTVFKEGLLRDDLFPSIVQLGIVLGNELNSIAKKISETERPLWLEKEVNPHLSAKPSAFAPWLSVMASYPHDYDTTRTFCTAEIESSGPFADTARVACEMEALIGRVLYGLRQKIRTLPTVQLLAFGVRAVLRQQRVLPTIPKDARMWFRRESPTLVPLVDQIPFSFTPNCETVLLESKDEARPSVLAVRTTTALARGDTLSLPFPTATNPSDSVYDTALSVVRFGPSILRSDS